MKEGVDILILGAGGCGAFEHDANRDAKLWSNIISKFSNCFTEVVFAILPDSKRPENTKAFEREFSTKL